MILGNFLEGLQPQYARARAWPGQHTCGFLLQVGWRPKMHCICFPTRPNYHVHLEAAGKMLYSRQQDELTSVERRNMGGEGWWTVDVPYTCSRWLVESNQSALEKTEFLSTSCIKKLHYAIWSICSWNHFFYQSNVTELCFNNLHESMRPSVMCILIMPHLQAAHSP